MNRSLTGKRTTALQRDALIVSVHDVSPLTQPACERILTELRDLGVSSCSLLVIPNHHQRGHFLDDSVFCKWLTAEVAAGNEAVVHGYNHRRERKAGQPLATKLLTEFYTAGEGEFFDLDRVTSTRRATQAREEFGRIGLHPEGFVAPAWLLGKEGEAGVKEAGYEYTALLEGVKDLKADRMYASQSLVWSVRSWWRVEASLVWNASLYRRLSMHRLLRLAIHPVDMDHPRVWRQIRRFIGQALKDRAPFSYERWITRQRALALRSTL